MHVGRLGVNGLVSVDPRIAVSPVDTTVVPSGIFRVEATVGSCVFFHVGLIIEP
jgi:hypothetical protein